MFTQTIVKILTQVTGLSAKDVAELIEIPPTPELGDYAFPCFSLAKQKKKAPPEIAKELANKISPDGLIARVTATGPYINFFLSRSAIVAAAFEETKYPVMHKTVVIEHSSPNIAKPFGIGHLRSTIIGATLRRIYALAGWNVIGVNHLGDWGTQFGKLIAAYKRKPVDLSHDPIKKLLELYVQFHADAEKDPSLEWLGREEFQKLEQGDAENRKLWEQFRAISLQEFDKIYNRLHVSFDYTHGESFYEEKMPAVIEELKKKNLLEESDGAHIINLDDVGIQTPALIIKSDGSTLYMTRDLATILFRKQKFKFDRMLYEVGNEQALHFKQLFAIIKKMGYDWNDDCIHITHGLYRFPDGKMSTRKGKTILVEDVLDQAVSLCLNTINEKNPDLHNKDAVAEAVGVGAVIFQDIKNDRNNDIQFDWDAMLDFEGESGPYLQYTHARLRSIMRKSAENPKVAPELLVTDEDLAVAKQLSAFKETIDKIISTNKPHTLAQYLLDLAQLTNSYYQKNRIIQEDKDLERARLCLIAAVADRLALGLSLLGIHAPEEM